MQEMQRLELQNATASPEKKEARLRAFFAEIDNDGSGTLDRGEIEQSGRWLPLLSARQLRDARGLYHVHRMPQGQLLR